MYLLLDFNIILDNKLDNLLNKLSPYSNSKQLGVILKIPKYQYDILIKDRNILYLNELEFIDSISSYSYFLYDIKKKELEILYSKELNIKDVLDTLLEWIPNDVSIKIYIPYTDSKLINKCLKSGFNGSYYSSLTSNVLLNKQNTINSVVDQNTINNVVDQTEGIKCISDTCTIKFKFSNETIKYLKKLVHTGSTINKNGGITQKEISGCFNVSKVDKNSTMILTIDTDSLQTGEEENAINPSSLYTFHTHPKQTYEKYNIKTAWPSAQDYLAFFSNTHTIFHTVVTIEGLYVITCNISRQKDSSIFKFISNNYNILCHDKISIPKYIKKINSILYNNKFIFQVKYINWKNSLSLINIFKVNYTNIK